MDAIISNEISDHNSLILNIFVEVLDFQKMKDQEKTRKLLAQVTNFVFIDFKFCCCILIELQNFLTEKSCDYNKLKKLNNFVKTNCET